MEHASDWSSRFRRWREASGPLLAGVAVALVAAQVSPTWFRGVVEAPLVSGTVHGRQVSLHFLVNDVFMTLFFGLATVELVRAIRPGGALHPLRRAVNPLAASLGGIAVPAVVYLALIHGMYRDAQGHEVLMRAWAIPTATDIALAWLAARVLFGAKHPAVHFLLVLAIADDIVSIAILAVAYPDSAHAPDGVAVALIAAGFVSAAGLRRLGVERWQAYLLVPGALLWFGLARTPVHPALAMVPIVPFFAVPRRTGSGTASEFEHTVKPVVDLGLFAFGFVNAGVRLGGVSGLTWVVLAALVLGKAIGVTLASLAASALGFPRPARMGVAHLLVCAALAGIGLTVALFVSERAFPEGSPYQEAARMGALLSGVAGGLVFVTVWAARALAARHGRTVLEAERD